MGIGFADSGPPGAGSGHHPGWRTGIDYGAKLESPLFMCRGEPWGVRAIQCMCAAHGLRTTPLHATTPPVQSSPLHHTPRLANRKVEGSRNTFPIQLKGHTSQTRIRSKTLPVSHSNNNNCYFGPWTLPHSIQLQPLSHSTPLHSTPPLGDRKG